VSAAIVVSAQVSSVLLARTGPKPFMVVGSLLCTGGMVWLTQISATSNYVTGVLGPTLVFGLGMGCLFVPLTVMAVSKVEPEDAGAASSLLNVMQQVGGSLGLSILVTVSGTVSAHEISKLTANGQPVTGAIQAQGLLQGAAAGFVAAAIMVGLAVIVSIFGVTAKASDMEPSAVPGMGA